MLTHGMRTLFLAQPAIVALVPSQTVNRVALPCIFTDNAPQSVAPPYVVIHSGSTDPLMTLDATYLDTLQQDDIDVDAVGYSIPEARSIEQAIRLFFQDYEGAAGSDDVIEAVQWQDDNYSYNFPDEGRDTKYHILTTNYRVLSRGVSP